MAVAVGLAGLVAMAAAPRAGAWVVAGGGCCGGWHGGWHGGWGGVVVIAPPIVVPPPVVYAPPPVVYAPPPGVVYVTPPPAVAYASPPYNATIAAAPHGHASACYAGPYICPLPSVMAQGSPCGCAAGPAGTVSGVAR